MTKENQDEELTKLKESWYEEARKQTTETLSEFIKKLCTQNHDYNTICYACAAGALASAYAINKSSKGGITGFQAQAIMWEFLAEWLYEQNKPLKLVRYENLLYPQYAGEFQNKISKEAGDWLKEKAISLLKEEEDNKYLDPKVREHWEHIANGELPFGFTIKG